MLTHETIILQKQNATVSNEVGTLESISTPMYKSSSMSNSKSASSISDNDRESFRSEVFESLRDDSRIIELEVEEKRFVLESKKKDFDLRHEIDIRKLESEERIAMHRIDADKAIGIAQAEAQAKLADAQALQTQLTMK